MLTNPPESDIVNPIHNGESRKEGHRKMNVQSKQGLLEEAAKFIRQCYQELGKSPADINERLSRIESDILQTGTYSHTTEELSHGAKMAWRNSNRCIGRLFWSSLHVVDARHLTEGKQVADALIHHIESATNEGRIRPTITIFAPAHPDGTHHVRIWNHQLIRYAGYETEQGMIGDPHSLAFTQMCQSLGWQGKRTPFDVLPLIIQAEANPPQLFDIPRACIMEVPLVHPEFEWFAELQLRWYAVPIISDMRLDIGGISYPAAPFNGWYMGTEIGARNLADEARYNLLPVIAEHMGLSTASNTTLWKDRALVELNAAVLHSFKEAGVSIVDHHTAAQQFVRFHEQEQSCERAYTGDWTWLIPPMSPASTPIFHQSYDNTIVNPNFYYQSAPYSVRQ